MQGVDFIQDLAIILGAAAGLGWLCQRAGLSAVVGYLVAGMLVGPHTPPFSLVTSEASIATAAQVGLVFLMFAIGLRLSLRRLKRLGAGLVLAVFASAALTYYATRGLGAVIGLDGTQTLFLAGMLMASSSAIIGKVLHETGMGHERSAQLAMGVTVLEDVVAVVMLTVLNSVIGGAQAAESGPGLGATLGAFGAFVVFAGIMGLLIVPWLLRKLSLGAEEELQTLVTGALLFALAVIAVYAGYSLALGAFLFGTIVAETPQRHQVDRVFEGMRDVFSAVFFVGIGLQIDVRLLGESWWLILALTAFTLVVRTGAVTTGLTLIGNRPQEALRAGLMVTPIGEFSFIIAQLGVAAMVVPPRFYPLAVGLSLMTSLVAPVLTRRSDQVATKLLSLRPRWLADALDAYHDWLERLRERQRGSLLWKLSRKRIIQIGVELLFVAGLLVFAGPMENKLTEWLGRDWLFLNGPVYIFWLGLVVVVTMPLYAAWRNLGALAMIVAEFSTQGNPNAERLRPLITNGARLVATVGLVVWVASFAPAGAVARWILLASVLIAGASLLLLRRRLVYWHSELEVELQGLLDEGSSARLTATSVPWLGRHEEWRLNVSECVIPDLAACSGATLAMLNLRARHGCTVVGIERQGCMISQPGPECALFPRDRVLLLGSPEQTAAAKAQLGSVAVAAEGSEFDAVGLEVVTVPAGSRAEGRTLQILAPAVTHGVQIAGIRRGPMRLLGPGGEERVLTGDELLAFGTPVKLRAFKAWVREVEPEAGQAT
jgi:CPA2 family monovalent cation:H+ antiporter-2